MATATSEQIADLANSDAGGRVRAPNRQSKRQADGLNSLLKCAKRLSDNHPKASVVVVVQSGYSQGFPLSSAMGIIGNDAIYCGKLLKAIETAIEQHNDDPTAPLDGLDLTSTVPLAGLEATLQEAQRRGMLGRQQITDLMDLAKAMAKGVRLTAAEVLQVLYCKCGSSPHHHCPPRPQRKPRVPRTP